MYVTDNPVKAKMFGNFELTCGDISLMGASKTGESQFAYLMQRLLHAGEAGVSRRDLAYHLFGDRDVLNVYHSLRNVVYNANQRLINLGISDHNCIIQTKDIYHWTDEIPVEEDAKEFERLFQRAETNGASEAGTAEAAGADSSSEAAGADDASGYTEDDKINDYLAAAFLCQGEFLMHQGAVIWVAQEAKRYREMFILCVEHCAALLRERKDWDRLAELGLHAARIFPLSDWEALTMEAYVALGKYDDARQLFEDTTDFYLREQGLRPTEKMMELLEQLADGMEHSYGFLEEIQKDLGEKPEEVSGGYVCNYPVFRGIYRTLSRMVERTGLSVYLMLCTIVDSKGTPMREGAVLDRLTVRLKEAICASTRYSDIINQYSTGQYLILLNNTTMENCDVVQHRIEDRFLTGRQRTGVVYHVKSVGGPSDH